MAKGYQTYVYVEFDLPVLVEDGENPEEVAKDEIADALSAWNIPSHFVLEVRVGDEIDE